MSDDLNRTENLLETHRPTLDDDALSRVRHRVETDAARRRTPSVLIVALLTLGFAFSAGGTGLAVSGLASDSTAVQAQYPPSVGTTNPTSAAQSTPPSLNDVAPQSDEQGGVAGETEETEESGDDPGGVAGAQDSAERDPSRELAAVSEGDELPFTGWAAVPILLLGLAMLAAGLVLRRRTNAPLA